jgi:hypothetical protein
MPLTEWAMTDNAEYAKHQEEIDDLILNALLEGPKRSYDLIDRLRIAGYGNARDSGPLELSYSMTGALYRSAYNSLRSRGLVCDSYDKDGRNFARPSLVFSRAQLIESETAAQAPPPPSKAEMLTRQPEAQP